MTHSLHPIGWRPLHPVETVLVSACVATGSHIRCCSCGIFVTGANDVDVYVRWKDHVRAAEAVGA